MIQLYVAKGSPEANYKIVNVIGCVLEGEGLLYASHVMSR